MDACISSMYIPGLECAFASNKEGVALVRMNSPEINISAIEIRRCGLFDYNQFIFRLHIKTEATDDEHTALFDMVNAPLQGVSGKTYDTFPTKYVYTPGADTHWGRFFAAQSRTFTPFESRPTNIITTNVVTDADVCDVIEAVFGLIGIFRDADTKPARMC